MATAGVSGGGDPYRGPDRRHRAVAAGSASRRRPRVARWLLAGFVLATIGLSGLSGEASRHLPELLDDVGAGLLTGAGVLSVLLWRVTGASRPLLTGAALVVLGVVGPVADVLGPVVARWAGLSTTAPGPLVVAGTAAVLLAWSSRVPPVDARSTAARALAGTVMCVGLVALVVVATTGVLVRLPEVWAWSAVAVTWAVLAVRLQVSLPVDRPLVGAWTSPFLLLLVVAAAARAAGDSGGSVGPVVASLATAVAGALALWGAAIELRLPIASQSEELLRWSVRAHEQSRAERGAQAVEQERLHEVRNLLAGLMGAAATLRTHDDRLDPGTRRRLSGALTAELRRLSHLVDPDRDASEADVVLEVELAPVLVFEREQGAQLQVILSGAVVRGRRGDIATIVAALLVNVRRHAPGSPVVLRAETVDGEVRLHVEDHGPGVPLDQRDRIFDRGERAGATTPGTGLGLYTAQRLAVDMGGTLAVTARQGGGADFVLTLEAGSPDCVVGSGQGRDDAVQVETPVHVSLQERRRLPRQRDHAVGLHVVLPTGGDQREVERADVVPGPHYGHQVASADEHPVQSISEQQG